ncbi:MAG TPA: SDR family NAD(P)-dependent oxidoreductase [Actinomycetota bacterium]|nr:SDR family NAD(P)-dependent oxidoreductase [Actinomycetota bacterium]
MTPAGKVLVTGGTGTIGRALLQRLVADGRQVMALARSQSSADTLSDLGAEPVRGSVEDADSVQVAASGCGTLFHAAGVNAFCLRDPSPLFRVNVIGSLNVISAAARAGVERVVYTSSAAVFGERTGTVGSETSEHRGSFLSEYERSKFEAERVVLETSRSLDVDVVCVNPSSAQGPGRAGGTGRILVLFLNGKLKVMIRTSVSLVDIADCTEGHVLAETNGKPGERYLLNGAALSVEEALAIVQRLTGVSHRVRFVPAFGAMGAGALADVIGRARRKDPGVCPEMVRTLLHGHTYDGSKAARELGLEYTPVEDTLGRTIDWLRAEGLVPL